MNEPTNGVPKGPLDDQIKFCQENRVEWESALLSSGAVGMAAKKNVAMYETLEASLVRLKELIDHTDTMYRIIHGEAKEETKAKSPETRIKQQQLKTIK